MKQSHTWNRFGEGRRLKIVETIDERLVELAEDILNEEKETIDLLAKIGEIKGLINKPVYVKMPVSLLCTGHGHFFQAEYI